MTDQDDQRTWRPPAAHRPDPGLPEARGRTPDDVAPTDSEGWQTVDDHLDLRRRGNLTGALDAAVEVTLDVPDVSALPEVIRGRFTLRDDYAAGAWAHAKTRTVPTEELLANLYPAAFEEDRRREPPSPPSALQALGRIIRRTKTARWLLEQRHRLCCDDCETRLDWDDRWSGR